MATFVLDAARRVYATLGWGWHEDVYREALGAEILLAAAAAGRAVPVQKEVAHPVLYRGRALSHVSLRMDMVVGARVVLELKATNGLPHGARRAARQCALPGARGRRRRRGAGPGHQLCGQGGPAAAVGGGRALIPFLRRR